MGWGEYDAVRTLINDGMDAVLEQAIERMTPFVMESLADRGKQWLDVLQLDKWVTEQAEKRCTTPEIRRSSVI